MASEEFSATELMLAMGHMSGISLQIHRDFVPIFATESYARFYGLDTAEEYMQLNSVLDLVPRHLHDLAKVRYQQVMEHGITPPFTLETKRVDGTDAWVRLQDSRLTYQNEYCVLTVLIDITAEIEASKSSQLAFAAEKKAREKIQDMQNRLIEQEKQTALNHLLIGMSHQLNTPLGNVLTAASSVEADIKILADGLQADTLKKTDLSQCVAHTAQAVNIINKSVVKASHLIKTVKDIVSNEDKDTSSHFELSELISNTLGFICNNEQSTEVLTFIQVDDDLQLNSSPGVWMQILTVLAENAIEHAFRDESRGEIRVTALAKGDFFHLTFSDNGQTIQKNIRDRIFEPFFSTNMAQKSGLGLSLVYNLVTRKLHGTIELLPDTSPGNHFLIKVPLIQSEIGNS